MNKLSWVFKKQLISKTTCESVNLEQSELQYGNEPYLHETPKLHCVQQVKNYPVRRAEWKSCRWTQVRCFWEQCQALAKKKRKPWEDATTKASEPRKESCMARVRDQSASVDHREKIPLKTLVNLMIPSSQNYLHQTPSQILKVLLFKDIEHLNTSKNFWTLASHSTVSRK